MVGKIAKKSDKVKLVTKARVKDLIITNGACTGCTYEKGGADFKETPTVSKYSGNCANTDAVRGQQERRCTTTVSSCSRKQFMTR